MKSNEIHILWSDYLHNTNPGTIVNQWFQDFLFHFSPPLAHILEVKVENTTPLIRILIQTSNLMFEVSFLNHEDYLSILQSLVFSLRKSYLPSF